LISSSCLLSIPAILFVFNLLIIEQMSLYVGGSTSSRSAVTSLVICNLSDTVANSLVIIRYNFERKFVNLEFIKRIVHYCNPGWPFLIILYICYFFLQGKTWTGTE
jgi:hypothetical protein